MVRASGSDWASRSSLVTVLPLGECDQSCSSKVTSLALGRVALRLDLS